MRITPLGLAAIILIGLAALARFSPTSENPSAASAIPSTAMNVSLAGH